MSTDLARARLVGIAALVVAFAGALVAAMRDEESQVSTESFCASIDEAGLPDQLTWGLQDYGYIERNLTLLSGLAYPEVIADEADRVIERTPDYLAAGARTDFGAYEREDQERDFALGRAMDDDLHTIERFIERSC